MQSVDKANDRHSASGKAITLGGAAISWASSERRFVTLPATEAEYVAVATFFSPGRTGSCMQMFEDNQRFIQFPRFRYFEASTWM